MLTEAARIAEHNNNTELLTTLAEEEALERCLEALGGSVLEQEREFLRLDWPALRELLDQGYSLDAHILPVLRTKAQSRRPVGVIRSWNYFAKAIAEYAIEKKKEAKRASRMTPYRNGRPASASNEAEQRGLQQALTDMIQNRCTREKRKRTSST
ncbi:hypothetical protein E4191_10890 [Paracoccus liaowanqingii]|uniref:Uncharacterized protein n=1 Tax=Paracoccus liaowanqingii TaxID=2560053 RepID=A0A4P7HLN6_9RHOB|nr:hypothetical protein [Paracoccus liaowanqingii]QBX35144.1 hypothetical protein E4191_10890 [Paracoccus liaowanqingii]